MTNGMPSFNCPTCNTLYRIVRAEAGPETVNQEITCRACGAPLAGRDGKYVVKYFMLRKVESTRDSQHRRAS